MSRSPTMPFGKYRGHQIADLPDDYLTWLQTIELHSWLREAVAKECDRRADEGARSQRRTPPPPAEPVKAPTNGKPSKPLSLAPLETDLAQRLMEEGVVIRGHDIARVVGLMAGKEVLWEEAVPQ